MQRKKGVCAKGAILLWLAWSSLPVMATNHYQFFDLGPFPGGNGTDQNGHFGPQVISENGVIVGVGKNSANSDVVAVWDADRIATGDSTARPLPQTVTDTYVHVYAVTIVNSAGALIEYVVGYKENAGVQTAFQFIPQSGEITLLPKGAGNTSQARGIVQLAGGDVLITGCVTPNAIAAPLTGPAIWRQNVLVSAPIAPVGIIEQNCIESANSSGQIVGYWKNQSGYRQAYTATLDVNGGLTAYQELNLTLPVGSVINTATQPNPPNNPCDATQLSSWGKVQGADVLLGSMALSISDAGDIVGVTHSVTLPKAGQCWWRPWTAFIWNATTMTASLPLGKLQLGVPGKQEGNVWPSRVNTSGHIVASTTRSEVPPTNFVDNRATVYRKDAFGVYVPVDLNIDITPPPGFIMVDARDINDKGEIVGVGLLNSEVRGFYLRPTGVPIPVPTASAVAASIPDSTAAPRAKFSVKSGAFGLWELGVLLLIGLLGLRARRFSNHY